MTLNLSSSPQLSARLSPDATGELLIDGVREDFAEESTQRLREAVLGRVGEIAASAGRPVRLTVSDEEGDWLLAVQPDGSIGDEESLSAAAQQEELRPVSSASATTREAPSLDTHARETPTREAPARESFLRAERTRPDRARQGVRGALARAGVPLAPSAAELRERAERDAVSRHWAGPRTIAIVNGKGGANKTPTTALLAAVFARNGGSGVLAWDNNETRGTLGWRTEKDDHDATVQSLLPATDALLSAGARTADIGHFMHHQNADKYDVLRSNPTMLATEQRISSADFDRLHAVATKFYRLVFIDSGNDESAERWLRMIDHTDQLVIATTALGEHAEAGALLLEALLQRDANSARLARDAVVIVSQSERTGPASDAGRVAAGFAPLARRAVTIPFDPEMHGGRLSFESLAGRTQRAWLHAAAAVAEGL
ncbi:AAA family ATPase [Leifsonia xyli]|uniref:AAA family ATPase n=1 Tax=Leifsonia xyli TaxID=1575 RepID=UPI003D670C50